MPGKDTLRTSATLLMQVCDLKDQTAWGRFVDRYRLLIGSWCRRQGLRHHDAEDVTAEVLAKLASAMPGFSYDRQGRFRSWLKSVVLNAARDFLRRRSRRPDDGAAASHLLADLSGETLDNGGPGAELVTGLEGELQRDVALIRQATERVRNRIESHTWQAFEATVLDERPGAEVAERLGISVASVHMAKSRVARMLREQFAELEALPRVGGGAES